MVSREHQRLVFFSSRNTVSERCSKMPTFEVSDQAVGQRPVARHCYCPALVGTVPIPATLSCPLPPQVEKIGLSAVLAIGALNHN
jgi:hypothetical protein